MKDFWKYFGASSLATFVVGIILIFVGSFIFFLTITLSFSTSLKKDKKPLLLEQNSVLHIKFNNPISDKGKSEFNNMDFSIEQTFGLQKILDGIHRAKEEDKIKGILLDLKGIPTGWASMEDIREALLDFKNSGKFIYSYSEMYSQKSYYLASVSDQVMLYPEGHLELKGLSSEVAFFKGFLEKFDLEMQIIRGSNNVFKSAVEPLMYDKMSEANRKQLRQLLSSLWENYLDKISQSRNIPKARINQMANDLTIRSPYDAMRNGIIDKMAYRDQLEASLKEALSLDSKEETKLNMVSFKKYLRSKKESKAQIKDRIGIIYAEGDIVSGKGQRDQIGSDKYAKALRQARKDSSVKAILLRVNSPGGSALASDVIWREMQLCKKAGKPLVVSMGNVAASGGYYIACPADLIYAQPSTITGSIGVFGIIPNTGNFFKNKLGITFDTVNTHDHSDLISMNRSLSKSEFSIIQEGVDSIYLDFISKVAMDRPLEVEEVDRIGQGRVWSGIDALNIGLVDSLGGLNQSIEGAAYLAGIEKFELREFPLKKKEQWEDLIVEFIGEFEDEEEKNKSRSGEAAISNKVLQYYQLLRNLSEGPQHQARMLYDLDIN